MFLLRHPFAKLGVCVYAIVAHVLVPRTTATAQAQTLIAVRTDASVGAAQLALVFRGAVPPYRIYGDGTADIAIVLPGTAEGPAVSRAVAALGPIASGRVGTAGNVLSLELHLGGPAHAEVRPGRGLSLIVELRPAATSENGAVVRELVRLNYADVDEVAALLATGANVTPNNTLQPQFGAGKMATTPPGSAAASALGGTAAVFGSAGAAFAPAGQGALGGVASPAAPLTSGLLPAMGERLNEHIAIDRRLNAVILTGPSDLVSAERALIDRIDVPVASVMLETQIVELDDTASRDLGIDFTNGSGLVATATLTATSNMAPQSALPLQAAVYAQIAKGHGRTLAYPRILTLDGTPASIITGDALPIVTSIALSGVNAVQQQVQYINVGVSLQIEPHITADGYVTAQIVADVSNVSGHSASYPEISQRKASTQATVRDGNAFVIGGLLEQTEIDSLAKVPGIGDIPLIGGFFRVRHSSYTSTNLYIIVVPHIIRHDASSPTPSRPGR